VYQVLVNQIAATMGRVKRAPMKIYEQSERIVNQRYWPIESPEAKAHVHDALLGTHVSVRAIA